MSRAQRLIIIAGQEGVGKSTILRALLPYVQHGAVIDAEDLGQANPWQWDDAFKSLLWENVASVARNFWRADYDNVVAGSFINDFDDFVQFRSRLGGDVRIYLVHLCATKVVRDTRRIARPKPTSRERRDGLDRDFPEDTTLLMPTNDYQYIRIDSSSLSVAQTIDRITRVFPEVFRIG